MPLSLKTMEEQIKGTSEIRGLERCRSTDFILSTKLIKAKLYCEPLFRVGYRGRQRPTSVEGDHGSKTGQQHELCATFSTC